MDLNILVVDDEFDITDSVTQVLKSINSKHTIHSASSSEEALNFLKKNEVDVVVTDIKMPGMSGLELLSRIKKTRATIQVVVMSGQGDMNTVMQCLKNHATDFLTKPFEIKDLKSAIKQCELNLAKWETDDEELLRLAAMEANTVDVLNRTFGVMKDVYIYTKLAKNMTSEDPAMTAELKRCIDSMEKLFEEVFSLKTGKSKRLRKTA